MYEQLRNEVLAGLSEKEDPTTLEMIEVLDRVADGYEITRKELGLTVYDGCIPEPVRLYLVRKKMAGLSQNTLENYHLVLSVFFLMVRKPLNTITSNDIRMWLFAYQKGKDVSARTLDKYRAIITRFFSWALDEGYISANPAKNVEAIKFELKPREALTQIQLEYVRKACRSARDLAIVETLYSTGCRVSELAILKKSDIDWRESCIHLFGKGKKHRFGFINAKAEVALKAYLDTRSDDCEYLFVSVRSPHSQLHKCGIERIIRGISERADIGKNITPHVMRHTTATIALYNGMPVEDISKMLGHEDLTTTMIYAKTSVAAVKAGHKKYVV